MGRGMGMGMGRGNHTTVVHPVEEQAAVCPACAKPFANSYYMKKHLRLVHGNMEDSSPQVSCEECGKQFANEVYLHHHKKYAHEAEDSVCEMCDRSYKNKRALQRHIRYAHSGKDNNPSPLKDISSPSPRSTASPGSPPSIQPAPPALLTPHQHQHASVSPPSTNPYHAGQWHDQFKAVPLDMAASQMEVARQQLQYMQRMQMDQGAQGHSHQGQGWFPRMY